MEISSFRRLSAAQVLGKQMSLHFRELLIFITAWLSHSLLVTFLSQIETFFWKESWQAACSHLHLNRATRDRLITVVIINREKFLDCDFLREKQNESNVIQCRFVSYFLWLLPSARVYFICSGLVNRARRAMLVTKYALGCSIFRRPYIWLLM